MVDFLHVNALLIAAAAGLGAVVRYLITLLPLASSWELIAINAVGCLLIGWKPQPAWWSTGFLGGFTSFSTYMLVSYMDSSLAYLVVAASVCIVAWFVGDALGGKK